MTSFILNDSYTSDKDISCLKRNKIIYNIDYNIDMPSLEKLITECEIDFFILDTTAFVNVKEYQQIIKNIKTLNTKLGKNMGIIVELRGRKIIAENLMLRESYFTNESIVPPNVFLRKGDTVILTNHAGSFSEGNLGFQKYQRKEILVRVKNLHQMLKPGEKVIINDNKGSFTVSKIYEHPKVNPSSSPRFTVSSLAAKNSLNSATNLIFNRGVKKSRTFSNLEIMDNTMSKTNDNTPTGVSAKKLSEDGGKFAMGITRMNSDESHPGNNNAPLNIDLNEFNISRERCNILNRRLSSRERDKLASPSLFNEKRYEIECTVDYDCILNKVFYIFLPSVDFKKYQVDVLSQREVAEIASLEKLQVNFLNISINDKKDIDSIRDILGDESDIKVIASITNIKHLDNINEILSYADGVVVSRTFQIITKENKDKITRLTNFLIAKSIEFHKPIYSYIDLDSDLMKKKKKFITDTSLILYNLIEGFDGFIVNYHNLYGNVVSVSEHIHLLQDLNEYFRYNYRLKFLNKINKDVEDQFLNPYLRKHHYSNEIKDFFYANFLFSYTQIVSNSVLVLVLWEIDRPNESSNNPNKSLSCSDIFKKFLHLRNRNPIVVISDCYHMILYANLFYNVFSIYIENGSNSVDNNNLVDDNFERNLNSSFLSNNTTFAGSSITTDNEIKLKISNLIGYVENIFLFRFDNERSTLRILN